MLTQAHYLRQNHSTRVPRCWIAFDTEARSMHLGESEVQTWRLGHAWHTCASHSKKGPCKHEREDFYDPQKFWEWISDRTRPKQRTVLVAHNLAYDLRISQAFTILPSLGWSLVFVRLDGNAAWCKWSRGTATLTAIDSTTWLPTSLENVGKMVDAPKHVLPMNLDTEERWMMRCRQDVTILHDAMTRIFDMIDAEDLGVFKPTGAGQSWAAFRHRFMTEKILCHDDPVARVAEREAAWTGRTEAWRHGDQGEGTFDEWDFTNAYARVALDSSVPVRLLYRTDRVSLKSLAQRMGRYAVLARVTITTTEPIVPARMGARVGWPVGTFQTVLWDPELRIAQECGAIAEVHETWCYQARPALHDWAHWILRRIEECGGDDKRLERAVFKHWSRALIGRFGSRWSSWTEIGEAPTDHVGISSVGGPAAGGKRRMLTIGGRAYLDGDPEEPADALPQIMGYVMSECRVRLWNAMQECGLENVLYVDTDSIICTAEGTRRLAMANVPGLRIKQGHRGLVILGPRQLISGGRLRAAGVSTKAVKMADGKWHSEAWRGLAQSLSVGESSSVTISPRTQAVTGVDYRRNHLPDGDTSAIDYATLNA